MKIFVIQGVIGIIWFVFWTLFIYGSPNSHPSINSEEKEYLIKELQLWKKVFPSFNRSACFKGIILIIHFIIL